MILTTYRAAYDKLLAALGTSNSLGHNNDSSTIGSTSTTNSLFMMRNANIIFPDQSDYPDVEYWEPTQWRKHWDYLVVTGQHITGKHSPTSGPCKILGFLQTADGVPLTNEKASLMHSTAYTLFNLCAAQGATPKKWSQVLAGVLDYYYRGMAAKYPEFLLASSTWKLDKFATEYYSQWSRGCNDLQPTVKCETKYDVSFKQAQESLLTEKPSKQ